jgi:SAM-dependent methyltransferase
MSVHPLSADRARLLEHFSVPDGTFGDRWASLWDAGDYLPWDKGAPNPALEDTLKDRKDLLGDSVFVEDQDGGIPRRRKRALVPGCGRGYDVLLLASYGYDAYGLDISDTAVKLCEEYAREHRKDYPAKDESVGAGKVKFIAGDFFREEWEREMEGEARFELLYDYTVLRHPISFMLCEGSSEPFPSI